MLALVVESERAWQALGHIDYGATAKEKKSMIFRRTLYVTKDMKAGDVLRGQPEGDQTRIRPASKVPAGTIGKGRKLRCAAWHTDELGLVGITKKTSK